MSIPMIQLRTEEIDTSAKRARYTVGVLGCGPNGVLHACLFADAGFRVTCMHRDQALINQLSKGKATGLMPETESKLKDHVRAGRITATTDIKTGVSQSDIVVLTTPVKIDEKKRANYSEIEGTCKQLGAGLRKGCLVVVTSTVGVGVTEGLIKEALENTSGSKAGLDFGLAYSPLQTSIRHSPDASTIDHRIVASSDKTCLNIASAVLESIAGKTPSKTQSVKTAELATLLEIVRNDVNSGLTNEIALLCEKSGVDYLAASNLADSGSNSDFSRPAISSADGLKEAYLLLEDAEDLSLKLRVAASARETNEAMIRHAVNLTKDALKSCGKALTRARITLLGIPRIKDMEEPLRKPVERLTGLLETRGAKVSLFDPMLMDQDAGDLKRFLRKSLNEALEKADCIVILAAHDQFSRLNLKRLRLMMRMPAAIVDLERMMKPEEVEEEGFIYRGLGRGVWTK